MAEDLEAEDRRRLDDDELADRVRAGDTAAFDELYRRHSPVARRTARWMTHSDHAADDVVADVFASMLSALRNGRGPHGNFTAYLKAAVRNRCVAHRKAAIRATPTDDDEFDGRAASGAPTDASATSQIVATAFAALTPRWQRTLWMSEVEGRPAKDIAAELKLPVAAVPALAYRARRAFAEAYLQQHAERASGASCKALADKLPRYVRGSASRRDVLKVDLHLEQCDQCTRTVAEMSDLNMSLRTLPAPPVAALAAGASGLAAWFATAAAISAIVVVPVVALRGDESPRTADGGDADISVPDPAAPLSPLAPVTLGDTTSVPPTTAARPDTSAAAATTTVPVTTDPAPGAGLTAATLPTIGEAGQTDQADQADQAEPTPARTTPPITLPASPASTAPSPATTTTRPTTVAPLLPPITLPVEVPLPLVPVDADVAVSGDGVAVGADVGLPAGLGGLDADASVGGDGVQATVVLPTVPIVGTLPPVVVDLPLPAPVADLVDGLLGGLLGQP